MNAFTNILKKSVMNGVALFSDEFAQKRRKTQNMVILVINFANAIVVAYIAVLVALVFYLDAKQMLHWQRAVPAITGYSSIVLISIVTGIYVLRRHRVSTSAKPFFFCLIINITYIFLYAVFLEPETYFFLFLFTTIPVSYISLGSAGHIRTALVLSISFAIAAIVLQETLGPLLPIRTPFPAGKIPVIYLAVIYITKTFAILTNIAFLVAILSNSHAFAQQTESELQTERKKSESLLANILPAPIIAELKEKGFNTPVRFDSASVVFTDFVGFTRIAERLPAEEVVSELDKCFTYFDQVTEKYKLEKLKTIGDAFMCAGGLPTRNGTHAIDCCLAALEIQSFMNQMQQIKEAQGVPYWTLRLGIHTGPLVAGVVGTRKFAYDVWGDTVNTASRLESSGEPGRINISGSTYAAVSAVFECLPRGKVAAKNKGEIDMYFLLGIKKKFSVDGMGRVPNQEFFKYYNEIS